MQPIGFWVSFQFFNSKGDIFWMSVFEGLKFITLPTCVDPVNEMLATWWLSHRVLPTGPALSRDVVTTFITPGGIPTSSAN